MIFCMCVDVLGGGRGGDNIQIQAPGVNFACVSAVAALFRYCVRESLFVCV
jgi:hypothetical protein